MLLSSQIVAVESYENFYALCLALVASFLEKHLIEDNGPVLLWSPEPRSKILDNFEKIKRLDELAQELGINLTLSSVNNAKLRKWGKKLGWKVLWDYGDLDLDSLKTG